MNKIISRVVLTGCIFSIASATFACSEFNHNFGGDLGVYTTITMDLFIDLKPNLTIYPRGTKETGGLKIILLHGLINMAMYLLMKQI